MIMFMTLLLSSTKSWSQSEKIDGQEVLKFAQTMPSFPNGEPALLKFFNENLDYPANSDWHGKIIMQFTIDTKGAVRNPLVIRKENVIKPELEYFEQETLRVINLMPNWLPGKNNGKNVPVTFMLPVTF